MRQKKQFECYLSKEVPAITSTGAVQRRLYLAQNVEEILGIELDDYMTEEKALSLLEKVRTFDYKNHGRQNVIRHYYTFITGKKLPRLRCMTDI